MNLPITNGTRFGEYPAAESAAAGDALLVKREDGTGTKQLTMESVRHFIKADYIGNNLLNNWYFVNPVNRNGKTSYSMAANASGIDRWRGGGYNFSYTLEENGLKISSGSMAWISQRISNATALVGKTVTISCLCNGELYTATGIFGVLETVKNVVVNISDAIQIDQFGLDRFRIVSGEITTEEYLFTAVKLELGDMQTLAHQDGNGNWVLNETPDYAAEMAKCVQYSLSSGEYIGPALGLANRNLLDNWYFVGGGTEGKFPVNQRGETTYTLTGWGQYFLDRWHVELSDGSIVVTLEDDGILVQNTGTIEATIKQTFSDKTIASYPHTISALVTEINGTCRLLLGETESPWGAAADTSFSTTGLITASSTGVQDYHGGWKFSVVVPGGGSIKIAAVKFEFGDMQTLAHQDGNGNWVLNEIPDYGEELAKCQRYYQRVKTANVMSTPSNSTVTQFTIPLPVAMRTEPVITAKDVGYIVIPGDTIDVTGIVGAGGDTAHPRIYVYANTGGASTAWWGEFDIELSAEL